MRGLAALALLALACGRETSPRPVEVDFDPGGLVTVPPAIVRGLGEPTRVTAYRIANQFDAEYQAVKDRPTIAGYPKLAQARVPPALAGEIATILVDPRTYMRENEQWMCIFEPHHVVRYESASGTTDVVICFKCGDLQMRSGKAVFAHSLAPRESRLHELVEKALPKEKGGTAAEARRGS